MNFSRDCRITCVCNSSRSTITRAITRAWSGIWPTTMQRSIDISILEEILQSLSIWDYELYYKCCPYINKWGVHPSLSAINENLSPTTSPNDSWRETASKMAVISTHKSFTARTIRTLIILSAPSATLPQKSQYIHPNRKKLGRNAPRKALLSKLSDTLQ